jgi:hypothetical protein
MASIRKEIAIAASAEQVWDAVRDVGAIHHRLARGFVTDTRLENGARVVTFANGVVVRELIVDIDDEQRRIAYSVVGSAATHHNASIEVYPDGAARSRLVWIADLLPNEAADKFEPMMEQGALVMQRTLENR